MRACNSANSGKCCDGPHTLAHRSVSPSGPSSGKEKTQLLRLNVHLSLRQLCQLPVGRALLIQRLLQKFIRFGVTK